MHPNEETNNYSILDTVPNIHFQGRGVNAEVTGYIALNTLDIISDMKPNIPYAMHSPPKKKCSLIVCT